MEKRYGLVTDYSGNVVPGSTITVTNYPAGTIATLFSDNAGTSKPNPFVANDADGRYTFYAADGRYRIDIAPPLDANLSASSVIDVILSDTAYLQKASKAEVAALPLTQYDAGKKIFITSADGGAGTIRYNAGGTSDDGGTAVGTRFIINGDPTIYWERDNVEQINVLWFGAVGDNSTYNTTAFQNAMQYAYATITNWAGGSSNGTTIFVPDGIYKFSTPVNCYSGVVVKGNGFGTILKIASGFTGAALFNLTSPTASKVYSAAGIRDFVFDQDAANTIWCIASDHVDNVIAINNEFKNLWFYTSYGMDMSEYTQNCVYDRIHTAGPIEQLIYHSGNANKFSNINKEGQIGTATTKAILDIAGSGLYLENIVLEGVGTATKTLLYAHDCPTLLIDHFHMEATASEWGVNIENCGSVQFKGNMRIDSPAALMKIRTSIVSAEFLNINSDDDVIENMIDIDSASTMYIHTLYSRRGSPRLIANQNIRILENRYTHGEGEASFFTRQRTDYRLTNKNELINSSFEAGNYGWSWFDFSAGTLTTEEYIDSPFGGLMMHCVLSAPTANARWRQQITIAAEDVGIPITVTAKVYNASSAGIMRIYFSGAGYSTNSTIVNTAWQTNTLNEWVELVATVIPQTTGLLDIGVWVNNSVNEFYIDEISMVRGTQAGPSNNSFTDINIGNNFIGYGSAAPTTGTWKQSDIIYNNAAAASGTIGWVCVTAGSPGTWKTFGSISA